MSRQTLTAPGTATDPPDPPSPARPRPRRRRFGVSRQTRAAWLFIAPAAFGFVVFYLIPTIRGVYFSFTDADLLGGADFVGLDNYRRLVGDDLFWNALLVTIQYVVINIGLQTLLAVLLAVMMHRLTQSMWVRGIVLLPYLVPNVVVALIWLWILDYHLGIGNEALLWMGLDRVAFLGSETWAIPTIAGINIWRHLGYTALLIFAGLQTIPRHLYEAAAIDGASETRMFFTITLPLLRPVLAVVLVISLIGSFQIFDTIAVTTAGGPVHATRVLYFYIYEQVFDRYNLGYGAALASVLLVLLALITIAQLRLMRANRSDLS